jgi:hypothetical protein
MFSEEFIEKFNKKVLKTDDCWIWLGSKTSDGYGKIEFHDVSYRAHRISYEIHYSDPGVYLVLHTCDNPACVNPNHLILGTHEHNVADRVRRGRSAVGEKSGRAKLKEKDIYEIRGSNLSNRELAKLYGMDETTIGKIRNRKLWKSVS